MANQRVEVGPSFLFETCCIRDHSRRYLNGLHRDFVSISVSMPDFLWLAEQLQAFKLGS